MGPKWHFRLTGDFQRVCVLGAFAGWVASVLGWRPDWGVPVPGCCIVAACIPLAVLVGTLPKWLLPARCPACRRFRAWVFTEMTAGGKAWKYRCRRCGHVHDTGVVYTYDEGQ